MLTTTSSDTPNNSGLSGMLLSNLYFMLLFLLAILVVSALYNRKNHTYYNFSTDNNNMMGKHILNTRYQLNQRKNVDLDHINSIICWYNIAAAVISCLLGAALYYFGKEYNFSLTVTAVTYLVLSFAAHFGSCYHIGRIYGNNKLKN